MSLSGGFVVTSSQRQLPLPRFRLLLDQGFPKPPGFAVRAVDATVDVVHLHDFNPALSASSTPDWVLYCVAVQAGFDALVARDKAQLDQLVEMYTLSRLPRFAVVTWRHAIEDPIREWGQLLAYLPEVKKYLAVRKPLAILLPEPRLSHRNLYDSVETLGIEARRRGISQRQAREEARREMRDWLEMVGDSPDRFDELLDHH